MNDKNEPHRPSAPPQQSAPAVPPVSGLLLFALFLIGANLRPALSSVATVLASIQADAGLSSTGAGVLTTLPILCFGFAAPLTSWLMRSASIERNIFIGLLALAAGMGMRVFFGLPGLFIGTAIAGAAIGVIMVLLPAIIKRDFARHAPMATGMYSMALCFGAALAAGTTAPLQQLADGDWRVALAFWTLPALAAAAMWRPQLQRIESGAAPARSKVRGLHKNMLAWQVTAYFSMQAAGAFVIFGWLPTILFDRGMSPLTAGIVFAVSIGAQLITSIAGPWLATRGRDQRAAIAVMQSASAVGMLGCIFAPTDTIWAWAVLLGLGQGGGFSIGLALIVLRSPNPRVAAALSGMVQGSGYVIAATGPLVAGVLHGYTRSWNAVGAYFVLLTASAIVFSQGAGRQRFIEIKGERASP
ncbi:MAG: cyanate transporter, major facilitator family protein [Noviherbaspirillum sp.]|nr:cyanate transporter, major facilitator family protein [Noviherbaspirillum sp.]